jgi:hypothetical protein
MRFAVYGRCSTEDAQDPDSSRGWQLRRARQLIEPTGGEIVAEYFDIGYSRSLPWKRREKASLLLDDLASPDRGFTELVIGEPQRAFYGAVRPHLPGAHSLRGESLGAGGRGSGRPRERGA